MSKLTQKLVSKVVTNQHYDETLEMNDSEDVASEFSSPQVALKASYRNLNHSEMEQNKNEKLARTGDVLLKPSAQQSSRDLRDRVTRSDEEFSENDEDSSEDDDEPAIIGAYDPEQYQHLKVSQEIKDMFAYITLYTPQTLNLENKLQPFIPDYIPCVGDIDAFIKVPRPDGKPDLLGMSCLDEPSTKQSDPSVLDLQLRSNSKQTAPKAYTIKKLESPFKNLKEIESWIESITNLHRDKPPPTVHYSKPMPTIETLMQAWPPEFEELLKTTKLPTADLDCDLEQFVDIICGLLDIPIQQNRIHALHLLFTLYSEFKSSQHFNQLPVAPDAVRHLNDSLITNVDQTSDVTKPNF